MHYPRARLGWSATAGADYLKLHQMVIQLKNIE